MSILLIKRHQLTGLVHVIRDYGDKQELVGIFYFLHDAMTAYPTAFDMTHDEATSCA